MTWRKQAVAWLRGKAAEQAQTNENYPRHAEAYPSWVHAVKLAQRFADEIEREIEPASDASIAVMPGEKSCGSS